LHRTRGIETSLMQRMKVELLTLGAVRLQTLITSRQKRQKAKEEKDFPPPSFPYSSRPTEKAFLRPEDKTSGSFLNLDSTRT